MAESKFGRNKHKGKVTFDTESRTVGMETQASKSICVDKGMMTNLRPANIRVIGIANHATKSVWQGVRKLKLSDSLYHFCSLRNLARTVERKGRSLKFLIKVNFLLKET